MENASKEKILQERIDRLLGEMKEVIKEKNVLKD